MTSWALELDGLFVTAQRFNKWLSNQILTERLVKADMSKLDQTHSHEGYLVENPEAKLSQYQKVFLFFSPWVQFPYLASTARWYEGKPDTWNVHTIRSSDSLIKHEKTVRAFCGSLFLLVTNRREGLLFHSMTTQGFNFLRNAICLVSALLKNALLGMKKLPIQRYENR